MFENERILVVDDDQDLLDLICPYLEKAGFQTLSALDASAMRKVLAEEQVDLVVLDLGLPDAEGFALLREFRRSYDLPVVLLTGKSHPVDRVVGLELGADDYIGKPFELRELVARIRSVLRRSKGPAASKPGPKIKVFDGWRFDEVHRELRSPSRELVELTGAEFELLRELINSAQEPVSRNQLLNAVRARDWMPHDRSIDVSISRLRKKLEQDPAQPALIKTVRNVGYILASTVSLEQEEERS